MHPQTGGSYRRETNGSLTRVDAQPDVKTEPQADAPAAPEQEAEKPADTETPPQEETSGRKGKA